LAADGSNAASILKRLKEHDESSYQRIIQVIAQVVPGVQEIKPKKIGRRWIIEFSEEFPGQKPIHLQAISMSDGTLRILAILLAAYSLAPPTLITLEEPEVAIHPGAIAALVDALKEAGLRTQILITTHSPDLITRFDATSLRAVERIQGISTIGPIAETQLAAVQQKLFTAGEIHRIEGLRPA
jgi:predicted ATPase